MPSRLPATALFISLRCNVWETGGEELHINWISVSWVLGNNTAVLHYFLFALFRGNTVYSAVHKKNVINILTYTRMRHHYCQWHLVYLVNYYNNFELIRHSHWRSCDLRKIMSVSVYSINNQQLQQTLFTCPTK